MTVTNEVTVELKSGSMTHRFNIPAGLRCRKQQDQWRLVEFPFPCFRPFTFAKHDAEQKGILLTDNQVRTLESQ